MMTLFEATNGLIGESYVRRYVWAESTARATELLGAAKRPWVLRTLMSETTAEFATDESDSGWIAPGVMPPI